MFKIVIIRGGLGNQMFGYAFLLSLKHKYKRSYISLDIWDSLNIKLYNLSSVFRKIKPKNDKFYHCQFRFYNNRFFKKFFSVVTENKCQKFNNGLISIYDGYWQSEMYFDSIEAKVRKSFVFELNLLNNSSLKMLKEIENSNAVSIHIRRGDYLDHLDVFGNICTLEYYNKALKYLDEKLENCTYYIFSDDAEWVRANFKLLNRYIVIDFNKGTDSWQDMFLMSKCKHNIIANSTFSWWGAWLNNNPEKIIIAPKLWRKDLRSEEHTSELQSRQY